MKIHPDILFFSSNELSYDGTISDPTPEENLLRQLMIKDSSVTVFLYDSEKFEKKATHVLAYADDIDT